MDSGACDPVVPISCCSNIEVVESEARRNGMEYEFANGATIRNEGERRCLLMTVGAKLPKKLTFRVAVVHKPLLSITRIADAGFDCWLSQFGGVLWDNWSDEVIPIQRKGNLYVMKTWIRQDTGEPFHRQE